MDLPSKPAGRFNDWCCRKPLVIAQDADVHEVIHGSPDVRIGTIARDVLFLNRATKCAGFEFVAFSNAELAAPVVLQELITLVPCFEPGSHTNPHTWRMSQLGRFIYDGWVPLASWDSSTAQSTVQRIDDALALFALNTRSFFEWQPKYRRTSVGATTFEVGTERALALNVVARTLNTLPLPDKEAVSRSVNWLSQALHLTNPSARFLLSMLAIEGLATHIEKAAADNSPLAALRADRRPKSERSQERERIIRHIIDEHFDHDPVHAIQQAYFNGVIPIKRSVERHLTVLFGSESSIVRLMFSTEEDRPSYYRLRSQIAHGELDPVHARELVERHAFPMEALARTYLLEIMSRLGATIDSSSIFARVNVDLKNVITQGALLSGPTHMADLYA